MSTISTLLNWGASYLINDFYRRFIKPNASEGHLVRASRISTVILAVAAATMPFFMDSIAGAWKLLLAAGAGTGGPLILRWFWWRVNAWSEVSAMATALAVSLYLQLGIGLNTDDPLDFAHVMLVTVAVTTVVWLAITYMTGPEPREKLTDFYRRIRPHPLLWGPVAAAEPDVRPSTMLSRDFLNWIAGCVLVYSLLFGIGKLVLKEWTPAAAWLALALASGWIISRVMRGERVQERP
jgi:Na+/proline symporter